MGRKPRDKMAISAFLKKLWDEHGDDGLETGVVIDLVKEKFPWSSFNKWHFYYYRNKHRADRAAAFREQDLRQKLGVDE